MLARLTVQELFTLEEVIEMETEYCDCEQYQDESYCDCDTPPFEVAAKAKALAIRAALGVELDFSHAKADKRGVHLFFRVNQGLRDLRGGVDTREFAQWCAEYLQISEGFAPLPYNLWGGWREIEWTLLLTFLAGGAK